MADIYRMGAENQKKINLLLEEIWYMRHIFFAI